MARETNLSIWHGTIIYSSSQGVISVAEEHGKTLYYTSDIAHRDKDSDYQIYSRADDAIRYQGELLNLPIIEGAAVSVVIRFAIMIIMLVLKF